MALTTSDSSWQLNQKRLGNGDLFVLFFLFIQKQFQQVQLWMQATWRPTALAGAGPRAGPGFPTVEFLVAVNPQYFTALHLSSSWRKTRIRDGS